MFCSQGCQALPTFPMPTLTCTVSHNYLLFLPIFVPASVNWSFLWNLRQALTAECIPCACGDVFVDRFPETSNRQLSELEPSPSSSSSQDQPVLNVRVCVTAKKPTQVRHCPLNSILYEDQTLPYPGPSSIPGCSVASQCHRVSPFATSPAIWDILFYKGLVPTFGNGRHSVLQVSRVAHFEDLTFELTTFFFLVWRYRVHVSNVNQASSVLQELQQKPVY